MYPYSNEFKLQSTGQLNLMFSVDSFQLSPPWKPDIESDVDTKYIPEEFSSETVQVTPPSREVPLQENGDLPYFEQFSFHGSRGSLASFLSTSDASNAFVL